MTLPRIGIAFAIILGCRSDPAGVEPLEIADPSALWFSGDFEQVTPPIRFPSPQAHREQVEVWLALDSAAIVSSIELDDGSATLRFGPGTRADRIEWNGDGEHRRIVDVRGTWIDGHGACSHHVLRPAHQAPGAALVGMQWPCDDAPAASVAAERMRARLTSLPPFSELAPDRRSAALDGFARQLDCDGCHRESRPDARRIDEYGAVWRGTDANGFFAPASSLRDAVPLEGYGAFDLNVDDPAITADCRGAASRKTERGPGAVRWTCADGGVPIGRIDWARAQSSDPSRVAAICRWRAWLRERLDAPAKAAFAAAFEPCEKFAGG